MARDTTTPMYEHADRTFQALKANLVKHLQGLFPVQGRVHRLVLRDLEIRDNADIGDYESQRRARLAGTSWSVPVIARLELQTLDGRVLDRAQMKLLDLPRLTNRGSYIVAGSEYMFPIQKRLRAGAYTRRGDNDELRTFFNLAKGRNFYLGMHPQKGHFQFQIDSSKNIPLYPLLRVLGVDDTAMTRAWGREVWLANVVSNQSLATKALKTIHEKMSYGQDLAEGQGLEEALREIFAATRVDPDNAQLTLGIRTETVGGQALLAAATKLLKVARGEAEEDNRDSLIHNDIVDLSDFVIERFNDAQFRGRVTRTIKFNIDRRKKISQIISRDAFQRPVTSMMTESQLAQTPTQSNPLGMISDYTQITVRGEGGIQEDNALTRGVRALDPSHLGFIDPSHTPEGQSIGTTLHLTTNVEKRGRDLVTRVLDVRSGKIVDKTPVEIFKSAVAFPESVSNNRLVGARVKVSRRGVIETVPRSQVDYAFLKPEHLVDVNSSTIPFLSHNNGTRVMTASKMGVQAKPLAGSEEPLVQVDVGERETIETIVGRAFVPKSPVDGVVEKIADEYIVVSGRRVPLPHYFPLNSNNFIHARPLVSVGDKVKAGQVLADTNYTRNGVLALGRNMLTAYVPYKGMNVEDGVVISRGAADKLASEHMYQQVYPHDVDTILDLKKFQSYFPAKLTSAQAQTLDDSGVVKKGQVIEPGAVLVAAMRRASTATTESQRMAAVSRILAKEYRDDSLVWDKDVNGVVQEVARRPREVVVFVRTTEPARIGDKIVGRYGNKGVIVHVLPDEETPRDAKGRTIDILLNPNGVISRMNIGQIMETTASRVAEKTGKPFIVRGFGVKNADVIARELKRVGVKDHETVHDPVDNVDIPGVLVGRQYIYKLEHQATKKISSRGGGPEFIYSRDQQPVRGPGGGRAIGNMELYGLLAHGATANVAEMYGVKGSYDYDTWKALESGAPLPPPKPSFVTEKFTAMLRGMGVDVEKRGGDMVMVPFLDRQVKDVSNGEITNFQLLRGKDLREEKNGLFDTKKTGGVIGDQWTHIRLPEPIPNPTFEDAVISLLHLSKSEYDDIVAGRRKIGALTGGPALKSALSAIDVNARLRQVTRDIVGKSGSELNKLHKELRYLRALKETGVRPGEYVINYLPVVPPKFRPVYTLPDGNLRVSDVNFHYQSTMQVADQLKKLKGPAFTEQRRGLAYELYKSVGGVMGVNDGIVERRPAPKGLAAQIAGVGSPKGGFFHERLLKRRQDISATSVVVSNPSLGMDELGVPEAVAWDIFRPFLIRELRVMGMTPLQAREAVDSKSDRARTALEKVMRERHVIANRAPTLHKFSIMAFKPRLVPGYAVQTSPLIVNGLNMDFDGDQLGIHVPISAEANAEAGKMLPSNNLYKPGTGKLQQKIEHEYVLGLFKISRPGRVSARRYQSTAQVIADLRSRKIEPDAVISVTGVIGSTTPGRVLINDAIPTKLRDYGLVFTDRAIQNKLREIDKVAGRQAFVDTLRAFSEIGRRYAYIVGSSFLLSDLQTMTARRNAVYRRADVEADRVRRGAGSDEDKYKKIVEIYTRAGARLESEISLKPNASGKSNNVQDMVTAGARGNLDQVKQMVSSIGVMLDHRNKPIAEPVRSTYTEGLSSSEFFSHMYSNRKGMIDKSQSVKGPGALTKQMIVSASGYRVTMADCGTKQGLSEPVSDNSALDRYLAEDVNGIGKRGDIVDHQFLARARQKRVSHVVVRSPLTCTATSGVCVRCYGLDEEGRPPGIGTFIGIKDTQGLTEPTTQLAMKAFHCNHRSALVYARRGETVLAVSMEELFQLVDSPITADGEEDIKAADGWEVYDGRWVKMTHVRRHAPDSKMVAVIANGGAVTICQDNHPVGVWANNVRCAACGHHRLKKPSPASKGTRPYCASCGHRQEAPEHKIGVAGFLAPREIEPKRVYLHRIAPQFDVHTDPPDINPYLAGMFVAEGRVSFRRASPSSKEKKPYSIVVSQNDGPIKDKIASVLPVGVPVTTCKRKFQLHSLELGTKFDAVFGRYSHSKALPPDFIGYPRPWLTGYLCGVIDGDGTVKKNAGGGDSICIDTTSFESAQQIVVIANLIGIYATVGVTPIRKLTSNQCFQVSLRMTSSSKNALAESIKAKRVEVLSPDFDVPAEQFCLVSSVKDVLYTDDYVYDATTETGSLYVSGVKHHNTGGVVTGKADLSTGFDRVKQLFTMPGSVRDKAVLSEVTGRVESVSSSPFGGTAVVVAGKKHILAPGRVSAVRVGDQVQKGQRLSDGDVLPQDMLRLNGLRAMQVQLRNDIGRVYESGGERLHQKTVEVPVRILTDSIRISDPGDHPSLVTGDYSTFSRVNAWNRENVGKKPVRFTHQLPGAEFLPHKSDDWSQRLAHNRIQQVLREAPGQAARAPLSGGAIFAPVIYGQKLASEHQPAQLPTDDYESDPWRSGGLTNG